MKKILLGLTLITCLPVISVAKEETKKDRKPQQVGVVGSTSTRSQSRLFMCDVDKSYRKQAFGEDDVTTNCGSHQVTIGDSGKTVEVKTGCENLYLYFMSHVRGVGITSNDYINTSLETTQTYTIQVANRGSNGKSEDQGTMLSMESAEGVPSKFNVYTYITEKRVGKDIGYKVSLTCKELRR